MNIFGRVNMPALGGTTEWLNSEPLGRPAELRGYVVLMNFWTLTCINSLRQALGTHGRMDDGA
jgi:hypothetical protein